MPQKGHQYPIDRDWKRRVLERLEEMKISQNELARRAKISKSALSEALDDESIQSAAVARIHKVLGWPEPPLVLTLDALELLKLYEQLPDFDRGSLIENARNRVEGAKRRS